MILQMLLEYNWRGLLGALLEALFSLSARMGIAAFVLLIAACITALLIGLAGMNLAKAISATAMGILGGLFGSGIYSWVISISWLSWLPHFLTYLFGLVFALLFFFFGWKKCRLSISALFAFAAYCIVSAYAPFQNVFLLLGAAVLLGVLAHWIAKPAFCALTSAIGAFALVALLEALLPKLSFLGLLAGNGAALWVASALSLLFFVVQIITTWHYKLEG